MAREPPADGDFLALVRWRAGLRWASNEGAVNLAVSEFPEVSCSSARKRVGKPLSARPPGGLSVQRGPEPRNISKASRIDRTSTQWGTRDHPYPTARCSGTSGAKNVRPTAQAPRELTTEGHFRNRAPTTQSAPALHKASPAPRAPPTNPLPPPLPASARPLPPSPRPAPFLGRGSRLVQGIGATSDWLRRSHEGAVVVFPEAITGQAQSFASVSSSS